MGVTVTLTIHARGKLVYETTGPWQVRVLSGRKVNLLLAVTGGQDATVLAALLEQLATCVGEVENVLVGPPFYRPPSRWETPHADSDRAGAGENGVMPVARQSA